MPLIVPSALGAAASSAQTQMDAMQQMQKLSAYKQDFDQANREIESENAFAEAVQGLVADEFQPQGDPTDWQPQGPDKRAQVAIDLAGRMTNPKHAMLFLEGVRGQVEQKEQEARESDWANRFAEMSDEELPPEDRERIQGLLDAGEFDMAVAGLDEVQRKRAASVSRARERLVDLEGYEQQLAFVPSSRRGDYTELVERYRHTHMSRDEMEEEWADLRETDRQLEAQTRTWFGRLAERLSEVDSDTLTPADEKRAIKKGIRSNFAEFFRSVGEGMFTNAPAGGPPVLDSGGGSPRIREFLAQGEGNAQKWLDDNIPESEQDAFLSKVEAQGGASSVYDEGQDRETALRATGFPGAEKAPKQTQKELRVQSVKKAIPKMVMASQADLDGQGYSGNQLAAGPASFIRAYEWSLANGQKEATEDLRRYLENLVESGSADPKYKKILAKIDERPTYKSLDGKPQEMITGFDKYVGIFGPNRPDYTHGRRMAEAYYEESGQ